MDFQLSIEDSTESSKPTGYHKVAEAVIYDQLDKGADLVVSMSGGKDSTATYLHLLEQGVLDRVERAGGTVRRVFADTGWELDETYAYLDVLSARFGPIDRVALWVPGPNEDPPHGYSLLTPAWKTDKGGDGGFMHADRWAYAKLIESRLGHYSPLIRLMMQWRKVPTSPRRWCTEDTKKRPIVDYLAECNNPVNAIGVRAEESKKRSKMSVADWSDGHDAYVWRPIFRLTKSDVIALHTRHSLAPNPLYLQGSGAGRVGCGPCVYSGPSDIRWLAAEHPERLEILSEIETLLHELNPPRMEAGHAPPRWFYARRQGEDVPISVPEAVLLSSDDYGGAQQPLLMVERSPGCQEWGPMLLVSPN